MRCLSNPNHNLLQARKISLTPFRLLRVMLPIRALRLSIHSTHARCARLYLCPSRSRPSKPSATRMKGLVVTVLRANKLHNKASLLRFLLADWGVLVRTPLCWVGRVLCLVNLY